MVSLWTVLFSIAFISMAATGCAPSEQTSGLKQGMSEPTYQYVRIDRDFYETEILGKEDFVRDHAYHPDYVVGYLASTSANFTKSTPAIVAVDEEEVRYGLRDPFSLEPTKDWGILDEDDFEDYHNYQELTAELERIADSHPELATLETAGQSLDGRELWYMKVSGSEDDAKPKLLYIANMHGDEVVGRELMIYLLKALTDGYNHEPRLTNLVNHAELYIMPSMNPDGFENRRRSNARGYDLNRNFPDFTTDPSDTPTGRQPETQAIMALHDEHHFVTALNFHGGEVCVNIPWDTTSNRNESERFGDDPLMTRLARDYADKNPTMRANDGGPFDRGVTYGYEWYEVDGGMQDWANYYRRSIHATLELSHSKWPPAQNLPTHWQENKESLLGFLESSLHGFHVRLVNQDGELVNGATIRHDGANRELRYDSGLIHRPANPGTYGVSITADGYEPYHGELTTGDFGGEYQTITLANAREQDESP